MIKNTSYPYLLALMMFAACSGFLDEKPNKNILVPESVSEFEALIDNFDQINISTVLPFVYADDYYTSASNWQRFLPWQQNAYYWSDDPYLPDEAPLDYFLMYQKIFYANIILDKINTWPDWSLADMERLKGKALFWRAHAYYELAVLHLPIPESGFDGTDYFIPLVTDADLSSTKRNASAGEVFSLIREDLENSLTLLPEIPEFATQPSRYGGYALLARINLYLGKYEEARKYAGQVLTGPFTLMDYGMMESTSSYPFELFNSETVLFTAMATQGTVSNDNIAYVSADLMESFDSLDLRLPLYTFSNDFGTVSYRGSYTGDYTVFTGIGLDEVYLILAESNVRLGNEEEGLEHLVTLLEKRYSNEFQLTYGEEGLLEAVLSERRKSLLFRGQRWADLKRFSYLDKWNDRLKRSLDGEEILFESKPENFLLKISLRELAFME